MKKLTMTLLLTLLLPVLAQAFEPPIWIENTATLTADADAAISGAGYLYGIAVATDATNPVTFTGVHDALTATGDLLIPASMTVPTSATDRYRWIPFNPPVGFNTGVSVNITLGGGTVGYMLYYKVK